MTNRLFSLVAFFLVSSLAFAQSAGKVAGVVTDANTGETLPGVNVIVDGTSLGSSTDVDGFYVILGVPVGNVDVRASYLGYSAQVIKDVRIVTGVTKTLNFKLVESVNSSDVVEVVADRPLFETGAVNQIKIVDSEELAKLPVRGVADVAKLAAGVVSYDGSNSLYIRGGRSNQVQYVVDGIPTSLPIMQENVAQYSTEIGGFSAKYGSVQSGLVHITTKSTFSKFKVGGDVESNALQDYNGNRIQLYASGPINEDLGYYFGVQYNGADDRDPRANSHNFSKTVKAFGNAPVNNEIKPNNGLDDYLFNTKLSYQKGKFSVSFATTHRWQEYSSYSQFYSKYNSAHNTYTEAWNNSGTVSLNYSLSNESYVTLKSRIQLGGSHSGDGVHFDKISDYGLVSKNFYPEAYTDDTTPTDGVAMTRSEYNWGLFSEKGRVNNSYAKSNNYTSYSSLEYVTQLSDHNITAGVEFEVYSARSFSIAPLRLQDSAWKALQGNDGQKIYHALTGGYGYDIYGEETDDYYDYNVDGQFNRRNPSIGHSKFAAYIQDKFELKDFIVSIGFRFDGFQPTGVQRLKDRNNFLGPADSDGIQRLDASDYEDVPMEYAVSPRIGFSFPVTDQSSFHAFYGVFRQEPSAFAYYSAFGRHRSIETDDKFSLDTGHLGWEKTDQYELGYKHAVNNNFGVEVTGFYKYQSGLENLVTQKQTVNGSLKDFYISENQDFAVNKGLTLAVDYRSAELSTRVDYTWSRSESTGSYSSSSFNTIFRNPDDFDSYAILGLSDYDRTHVLNMNVDYRLRDMSSDLDFLNGVGLNLIYRYASGFRYTPVESQDVLQGSSLIGNSSGSPNSSESPSTQSVDFRIEKAFEIDGNPFTAYVRIENLFDESNPNSVYQTTGEAGSTGYLETAIGQEWLRVNAATDELRAQKAQDRALYENSLNRYGQPRLVYLGLRFNF